jgi:hypothetical protein
MTARPVTLFATVTLAGSMLAGCGALPGGKATTAVNGATFTKLGFGAEGGAAPALVRRANGEWLVVYVGTNVGDRHLYWATSTDGARWSPSQAIEGADYSEQAPALVEDASGVAHLFFASNRNGQDFELFTATLSGSDWSEATAIPGYTGVQDLAAAYANGKFLLACELSGAGLVATTSADGATFADATPVADAGFDPAAAFLPDGKALVAYTSGDDLLERSGAPGAWGAEKTVVTTKSRLRGPALVWAGDHGKLVYAERQGGSGTNYQLKERRFDAGLSFTDGKPMVAFGGEANQPALAIGNNGKIGLAWGMKLSSSQQGVAFTLDGWK